MKKNSKKRKAVVLLSGGLDSTVTLFDARARGYCVHAVVFDYGQRHRREKRCALAVAAQLDVPVYEVKISLPWGGSALTDEGIAVPENEPLDRTGIPVTYVPGRNSIFLSFAFSCAEAIGARRIFIGAHVQDYSGYPDCRPEFIRAFEEGINKGLAHPGIRIEAPLLKKTKKDIIRLGLKLGVDFAQTWSCYKGGKKPCGVCDSCRYRMRAFEELGMTDPAIL